MRGTAKRAADCVDKMLEAVYEWEAKADAFVATGNEDDDVVVTHDSRGRMIEVSIRPGLQRELTTDELEDCINDAIAGNASRARDGLNAITNEFLAQFAQIPEMLATHPVGARFTAALSSANRGG
jgi:hypothetical protein